jgi:sec-independent protein translocase protein TatA
VEALTPWHLALILLGFMVLFGYKKLPDASRSLGRSLRIFRTELRASAADDEGPTPDPGGPDVAALEAEARAAEAHAAMLRARVERPGSPSPG